MGQSVGWQCDLTCLHPAPLCVVCVVRGAALPQRAASLSFFLPAPQKPRPPLLFLGFVLRRSGTQGRTDTEQLRS
jgi:hypothetical protein